MGVWLPLALADLAALMVCQIRMWTSTPEKVQVPSRSETLAGWCLPMLSTSLKAAEEEQRALALFNSVKNLAAMQEKYGRSKNADQVHK